MQPIDDDARPTPGLLAAAALAGGAAALGLYAALVEPRRLQLRRTTVHVRGLPPALEGFRIALLSDFHAGRLTPRSTLRRAARAVQDAAPDLIALTGDFVDRRPGDLERALQHLKGLHAPCGVYAVPGNHDHAHGGLPRWRRVLATTAGIQDLTNRCVLLDADGARLCVAGVDDLEEGYPDLVLPPPEHRDFTLLLAHNPDQAERTRREGDAVDLILSGHTHGGQIRIPALGPVERKSDVYDQGLRRRPWTQVYTSRGLGSTFLPLRFGARPEAALLRLTARPREDWSTTTD